MIISIDLKMKFYLFFFILQRLVYQIYSSYKDKNLNSQFTMNTLDPISYSQNKEVVQKKLFFDVEIDMDRKFIKGKVRIFYTCIDKKSKRIVLDSMNLNIIKILDKNGQKLNFFYHKQTKSKSIGEGIIIFITHNSDSYIDVYYSTTNRSIGLHFSSRSVLNNKNYGFMYTHAEAIYSRSIFPCQDTPSLKVKLSAKIRIKKPYDVLFSGLLHHVDKRSSKTFNTFYFKMRKPIPTYLVTFTAGKWMKKKVSSNCIVYGEKKALKGVKNDFAKCENYLMYYKNNYSDFFFKKMKFLILPNDFPYAGMENPYVTYIAASTISGEASFSSTIAHEIAHFWSGNLVTNLNWKHFWLNEGITTYITRKAIKVIEGDDLFGFQMNNGRFSLDLALKDISKDSKLDSSFKTMIPNIIGVDPYETFSRIPYEKGCFLLYHIEKLISEKNLNKIIGDYFKKFKFSNSDTNMFIDFVNEKIIEFYPHNNTKIIEDINWNSWINSTDSIPFNYSFKTNIVDKQKKFIKELNDSNYDISYSLEEFSKLTYVERDRILKELREKIDSFDKNRIEILLNKRSLFKHITLKADSSVLRAKLFDNDDEKINYIQHLLKKLKYYKTSYLKQLFYILKNSLKTEKVEKILSSIKERLNPLAFVRIKELIHK